jgi:hypothetical protein
MAFTCLALLICICALTCRHFNSVNQEGMLVQESVKTQDSENKMGFKMCQTDSQSSIPIEKIETTVVSDPGTSDLKQIISQSLIQIVSSTKKNQRLLSQSKCHSQRTVNISPVISKLQI